MSSRTGPWRRVLLALGVAWAVTACGVTRGADDGMRPRLLDCQRGVR